MRSHTAAILLTIAAQLLVCEWPGLHAAEEPAWFVPYVHSMEAWSAVQNPGLESELSITEEQRATFLKLRERHFLRMGEIISPLDRTSDSAEVKQALIKRQQEQVNALEDELRPRVWNTLTPQQRDRLKEIFRQVNVMKAFRDDPEVVASLKLSDRQKSYLGLVVEFYERDSHEAIQKDLPREVQRERKNAAEAKRDDKALQSLNSRQKEEWSRLVGKPYDVTELRSVCGMLWWHDSPRETSPPAPEPQPWFRPYYLDAAAALELLAHQDLEHGELSLTAEQRIAFDDLMHQLGRRGNQLSQHYRGKRDSRSDSASYEEHSERQHRYAEDRLDLENEIRPQVWELLTESQRRRLSEIVRQSNVNWALLADPDVIEQVKPTPEQTAQLLKISKVYDSDHNAADNQKDLNPYERRELNSAVMTRRDEASLKVLNDQQRQQWNQLAGQPYETSNVDRGIRSRTAYLPSKERPRWFER